jgi:N-acetylmuramoyl-L-alanine amidase
MSNNWFLKLIVFLGLVLLIIFSVRISEKIVENKIINITEENIFDEKHIAINTQYSVNFNTEIKDNEIKIIFHNTSIMNPEKIVKPKSLIKGSIRKGLQNTTELYFSLDNSANLDIKTEKEDTALILIFRDTFPRILYGRTIVVDPGHGGYSNPELYDCGAKVSEDFYESRINLAIVNILKKELESRGATVLQTRDRERYIYTPIMFQREHIINDAQADLFVSVHQNSADLSKVRGTEVFYNKKEYEGLATTMLDTFAGFTKIPPRRICLEDRDIIHGITNTPSIIIECVFITNPDDQKILLNTSNYELIAQGIKKGIIKYFENISFLDKR